MTERIIKKLDEYLGRNDYTAAESHLLYWLDESKAAGDRRKLLLIYNELMGLNRKLGKKERALEFAALALSEIEEMNIADNIGAATTYINCATVYKAFSLAEKSMPLFERAKVIYEKNLQKNDSKLGGLYNNMALALIDLKRFEEAYGFYGKALEVMGTSPEGEPEMAVTYLNMASAAEAELGAEKAEKAIDTYIHKAMSLLDKNKERTDGNYAFVCEKCAGVFGYYGYFVYDKQLKDRARRIYERN